MSEELKEEKFAGTIIDWLKEMKTSPSEEIFVKVALKPGLYVVLFLSVPTFIPACPLILALILIIYS